MEKKDYCMLFVFGLFLILFAIFTTKISFPDSPEYITAAKNLAGINNIDMFTGHSLLYPYIISLFLRIWPNLIIIKLVNTLWIFLIGLILLVWLKNRNAFLIFAFSPLTWFVSVMTIPALPAGFFLFLSFLLFKKKFKYNLIYSGIFFGLSFAFYDPILLFGLFFVLIYFWNRNLSEVIVYLTGIFVGTIPRLILDYHLFKMPLYTFIRYAGANLILTIGLNPNSQWEFLRSPQVFLIFIAISPFLFRLYKLDFKKYCKLFIFLGLITIILIFRTGGLWYFILISPIIVVLLSKTLSKKEILMHSIISIGLIIILTGSFFGINSDSLSAGSFFGINSDSLVKNDIEKIIKEFDTSYIIGGPFESIWFSIFSWENKPYFVWYQDYEASLDNRTTIREYNYSFDSRIPLKDRLRFSASFDRFDPNKIYDDYILVTAKKQDEFPDLSNFTLNKCYEILCVYEK